MLIDTRPTRPARLYSRPAASRSRARWVEVDARVEVWRADKDGDADGDGEGGGGGKLLEGAHWVVDAMDKHPDKGSVAMSGGTKVCALLCARFPREPPPRDIRAPHRNARPQRAHGQAAREPARDPESEEAVWEDVARPAGKGGGESGTLVGRPPLDEDDVALLFEDVHRGRSVVPPPAVPVKPTLVRWDSARALGVENVVVMNAGEAGV
ncbi:hypothetical protein B0H14DRAFT_3581006 [Mycena olivaceomarginata]|nr:hypothetical protein B0H14DRAFT_3581006 [Mycena olivaceomarginata]